MIIHDCEQRSEEWDILRRGRITATGFQSVQAKGQGLMRTKYMKKLRTERLHDVTIRSGFKTTEAMKIGIEREDEAREAFEKKMNIEVQTVGFVECDNWIGISPDGLIGKDGGVEIKCPNLVTHDDYIESGKLPNDYKWQVHGSMMATGRKYWYFVSYHPDARKEDRLFILKVERDEELCSNLRTDCDKFILDLKAKIAKRTGMNF